MNLFGTIKPSVVELNRPVNIFEILTYCGDLAFFKARLLAETPRSENRQVYENTIYIDRHCGDILHCGRARAVTLKKNPLLLSTLVLMHGGLICIAFCLSVCLSACLSVLWTGPKIRLGNN